MIYYHYSEQVKDLKNTAAMFWIRAQFCSGKRGRDKVSTRIKAKAQFAERSLV